MHTALQYGTHAKVTGFFESGLFATTAASGGAAASGSAQVKLLVERVVVYILYMCMLPDRV